jgi:hypothetical protein
MTDSPSKQIDTARKAVEGAAGFALRATGRGALVLQTENARRMMRRVGRFAPRPEAGGAADTPPPVTPAGS